LSKRKNRSDAYQWVLNEIPYSAEMMCGFTNSDSLGNRIEPHMYNERIEELKEELLQEFWKIVKTQLTKRQSAVIELTAEDLTQMEIAKILGVNQSSITKSLHGNVDYKNGKKVYGGSIKKLQKIMKNDPNIKRILQEIEDLKVEKY